MRVGINATCLNDRPSGAKQRFLGIYGTLFQRLPDVEFVIFEPQDCHVGEWFAGQSNVSKRTTPIPSIGRAGKLRAGLGYWRQAFAHESFDLFEAMHLPLVRPAQGETILTIHDVRGLYANNSLIHRTLFTAVLLKSLQRADHVVTVSNAMRAELLAFYPHTPVSVVYNGLDTGTMKRVSESASETFRANYKLPNDFVLAVGHFERRKNYPRLIDAIALLKQRGFDCPLVIVGNDSGEAATLARQIALLNLSHCVTLLTGLSDDEVRCAYRTSSLLVFPSSYEGFGIPILEAMAAGKPMVLSDLPIFREITEDRSIYFDQQDAEAIANAIQVGLSSQDVRTSMIEYGLQRVRSFDFGKLAENLAKVYHTICA